jgi:flotillin
VARAEAEKQTAVRQFREAELNASQIPQARADADQNLITQEAQGRGEAARILAVAEAEAAAIRLKAQALLDAGSAYLDLRRLELAPELTAQIAGALANSQFVNFGTTGGPGGDHGAVSTGSDDVLRVVQTLMAAQVLTGSSRTDGAARVSPPAPNHPSSATTVSVPGGSRPPR